MLFVHSRFCYHKLTFSSYGPHKLAKLLQKVLLQKENGIVRSAKENGFTSPLYTPTSPGATSRSEESLTPTITLSPTSTAQVDPLSQSQNLNSPGIWSQESANQSFGLWRQTPPETPTPAPPVAASAPPVTAPVQETCKQTARDEGLRVLLVEDNEINLKLLVAYMRKLKLDHATATNGLEALDTYKDQEGRYDVIFMGKCLPVAFYFQKTDMAAQISRCLSWMELKVHETFDDLRGRCHCLQ